MHLTLENAVLVAYNDLALRGLLEPSPKRIIRSEKINELLPERLIALVKKHTELERLAGLVFRIRIMARKTSELRFTAELADVLYQLARSPIETERCVQPADALDATAELGTSMLGVFVALALLAKRRMIERGMIEQDGQEIRFTLATDSHGRDPRAGLPEQFQPTAAE